MTQLLDLPTELLSLVLLDLGGGELRKNVSNLTICRKWYHAALEIYHSGRHLRDITLKGCNINRLSDVGSYSGQRKLMHKNTRNLHIRLLGHWRDQMSQSEFAMYDGDVEGLEQGKREREEIDDSYAFGHKTEEDVLTEWHVNILRPRLLELFLDLPRFSLLESFTLESMAGKQNRGKSIGEYIDVDHFTKLLETLLRTKSLKRLTLDIPFGLSLDSNHDCHLLSQLIPQLEQVRIRLHKLCPRIFNLDSPQRTGLEAENVRLKSLVLKLHLPVTSTWVVSRDARTMDCLHAPAIVNAIDIIGAAKTFAGNLVRGGYGDLELLRVSYVDDRGPNIYVFDCLNETTSFPVKGWPPQQFYAYEDDGTPWWFEEEDADRDRDGVAIL